jgi:hypothetical protein
MHRNVLLLWLSDMSEMTTTDREIRAALHSKKLRSLHQRADTLIIDELGLAHAKGRIDVAVINGCLHGYEIKSGQDTLDRLPQQLTIYEQCLEKLTIVCAEKHLAALDGLAPIWCGIVSVNRGSRSSIRFENVRTARKNPNVSAERLAYLLWRDEAVELLMKLGVSPDIVKMPKKILCAHLGAALTVPELTVHVKTFMKSRQIWRDHRSRASCDG